MIRCPMTQRAGAIRSGELQLQHPAILKGGAGCMHFTVACHLQMSSNLPSVWQARGFEVTPYLAGAVRECEADLASDPAISKVLRPGGASISAGYRLIQTDYAKTLRLIARDGAQALHGGPLGDALVQRATQDGGTLSAEDLLS